MLFSNVVALVNNVCIFVDVLATFDQIALFDELEEINLRILWHLSLKPLMTLGQSLVVA